MTATEKTIAEFDRLFGQKLIIDPEFEQLIPPLADDDYSRLKDSLLTEGCRDPITVWNGTIVDGHNRYHVCTENNIPFETKAIEFASRDEAMLWMIDAQLARRNVNTADRILLAQKKKPILEQLARNKQVEAGKEYGRGKIGVINFDNSYSDELDSELEDVLAEAESKLPEKRQKINVQKEVAKMAGVSTGTVGMFEKVQKEKPELIDDIRNHKMSINEAYSKVKAEKKKAEVLEAEQSIAEQATETYKPILHIGNSIGYVPDEKYDLLLTDPPYSTDVDNIEQFVSDWLYNALDNVKDTGFAYIFIGAYPEETKAYLNARIPEHMKLEQMLVWTYKNTLGNNPKDRYKLNYQFCLFYRGVNAPDLDCPLTNEQWAVQEINAPDGRQGDRYHAWQKPMEIAERFIRHSTKQDMTVFDPFACTGTFLLAAAKLGRKAYGFEINPENADIAFERGCLHE